MGLDGLDLELGFHSVVSLALLHQFGESLVKKRLEDMAAINLRATSYIKVVEFTRKNKEVERRSEEGTRSRGEKAVIEIRSINNKGGPLKTQREDKSGGEVRLEEENLLVKE